MHTHCAYLLNAKWTNQFLNVWIDGVVVVHFKICKCILLLFAFVFPCASVLFGVRFSPRLNRLPVILISLFSSYFLFICSTFPFISPHASFETALYIFWWHCFIFHWILCCVFGVFSTLFCLWDRFTVTKKYIYISTNRMYVDVIRCQHLHTQRFVSHFSFFFTSVSSAFGKKHLFICKQIERAPYVYSRLTCVCFYVCLFDFVVGNSSQSTK